MPAYEEVFEAAHAHVAKWEGGFFNHPNDPGGITNHGVSLMFLKGLGLLEGDINGDGQIDREDVLAITRENSRELFRRHFWDKPGAASLPPLIAAAFYDLAVNAGTGRAAIVLQEGINAACGRMSSPITRPMWGRSHAAMQPSLPTPADSASWRICT